MLNNIKNLEIIMNKKKGENYERINFRNNESSIREKSKE